MMLVSDMLVSSEWHDGIALHLFAGCAVGYSVQCAAERVQDLRRVTILCTPIKSGWLRHQHSLCGSSNLSFVDDPEVRWAELGRIVQQIKCQQHVQRVRAQACQLQSAQPDWSLV